MSGQEAGPYRTSRIEPGDISQGFRSGKHSLDDYFKRHALANDRDGIGCAFVLRRPQSAGTLPSILGFYTLSMAEVGSKKAARVLSRKLPQYPMPAALIGRLAVDKRAQGQRFGEKLLLDALRRVVDVADWIGCLGIAVDAMDEDAEGFYSSYGFTVVEAGPWPRRMFLPLPTAKAALLEP